MGEGNFARAVRQKVCGAGEANQGPELVSVPRPGAAEPGSVVVRIIARPIHPFDRIIIKQSFSIGIFDKGEFVPGSEGFGIVEEVGEGVRRVKKGDRVVPIFLWNYFSAKQGSWQDFVTVSEKDVILMPHDISDEDAAQLIINPWTGYGLLKDINAPKGSYVLQNGAGSVLGRIIIKLAKHWGIKTINLVRRDEIKEELKSIGADEVLNVTKEDVAAKVKELTNGAGVEGAIDMVSGSQTKLAAACVKSGGKVFTIGSLESSDSVISVNDLARKVSHSFWSLTAASGDMQELMAKEIPELFQAKIIGSLPVVAKFPLEDYETAMEQAEKQARQGKVLLVG
ncbi:enoyl-[acyl-carrier-protein] reductase, mitochondrial [Selaginella moellendorffii]|uniref:enoyl-[acyl-carrier-protein] reductase, mitochondrial n=1 Tax=Selaginella moellendorffii TaxID=88036 RepID=UPI000D1CAEED|nr:enoyl-[acyl-carrier-protein] reductase, mitochondrial [Selaginella moellendorffii]|eukprot:XP_024524672.1 enoyl-[acyl-carrier-protein] reductase, mitochondrial [Selaginella moellendorffii]